MIKFNGLYCLLAASIFAVEVYIAIYRHDKFIRPYFGDLLVVMLIYCAIKTIVNSPPIKTAIMVFFFACLIELSQYFHLVVLLGWGRSTTAATVLGTFFSFTDILMYALGVLIIISTELYSKNFTKKTNGTSLK